MLNIIQLSDIHGSRVILDALPKLAVGTDLFVVSGDVTTFGDGSYFDEFMYALKRIGVKALYVPGNNDLPDFQLPSGVESIDGRKIQVGRLIFGGIGGSPPTPFGTPNEVPEDEISKKLNSMGQMDVLVSHAPPHDTPSDQLRSGEHAGSISVREYILRRKPRLVLCGHIHEAVSKFYLGDTLVVNPGAALDRRYSRVRLNGETAVSLLIY